MLVSPTEEKHLLLYIVKIEYIILKSVLGYGQSAIVTAALKSQDDEQLMLLKGSSWPVRNELTDGFL